MTKYLLLAALTGFVGSLLTTKMLMAINDGLRSRAMILELLAGGCAIVAWQLWAATQSDWRILGAELLGTVAGTGVAMTKGKTWAS